VVGDSVEIRNKKRILKEQKKRLEQELSMNPPIHRKLEIGALLYHVGEHLRSMGVR